MQKERRTGRMDRRRTLSPRREADRLRDTAGAALPPPPAPSVSPGTPVKAGELPLIPVGWCGAGALIQILNLDGTKAGIPVALLPGSFLCAVPPPHGEQFVRAMGILPQLVGKPQSSGLKVVGR